MRKLIVGLIIFLSVVQIVTAQVPVIPGVNGVLQPGVNCGGANQKCCYFSPSKNPTLFTTKPNIFGMDQIIDGVNSIYKQIVVPIIDPLNQVTQKIIQPCLAGEPSTPGDLGNTSCTCTPPKTTSITALANFCQSVNGAELTACNNCLNDHGIWTGLGCIYPNIKDFIEKTLLGIGVGLAGVISLLCIIYSAYMMQTSQGSPEKIKKAQELLTSCIMGLMLIIFSVFILRLIGINILRIPGFK